MKEKILLCCQILIDNGVCREDVLTIVESIFTDLEGVNSLDDLTTEEYQEVISFCK